MDVAFDVRLGWMQPLVCVWGTRWDERSLQYACWIGVGCHGFGGGGCTPVFFRRIVPFSNGGDDREIAVHGVCV